MFTHALKNHVETTPLYTDHDPSITVELTPDETLECIRITIGGNSFLMHTRSAIDLSQKLQKAILSWIGRASDIYLEDEKKEETGDSLDDGEGFQEYFEEVMAREE